MNFRPFLSFLKMPFVTLLVECTGRAWAFRVLGGRCVEALCVPGWPAPQRTGQRLHLWFVMLCKLAALPDFSSME